VLKEWDSGKLIFIKNISWPILVKANQELQINEVDLGVIIINLYLQIYI
jgi:hypothetical protein